MNVTRWGIKITDGPRGSVGVYMDVFYDGKYVLLTDYRRGVAEARAAALRDAVEAVKALDLHEHYRITCEPPSPVEWSKHRDCDAVDDAVAAIEALGGER